MFRTPLFAFSTPLLMPPPSSDFQGTYTPKPEISHECSSMKLEKTSIRSSLIKSKSRDPYEDFGMSSIGQLVWTIHNTR